MPTRWRRITPGLFSLLLVGAIGAFTAPGAFGAASEGRKEAPFTVGQLAKQLVAEMAIDGPAGGYGESLSLGIMTYMGYHGLSEAAAPATTGDLQQMLSVVGIQSATGDPAHRLSSRSAGMAIEKVRTNLPKFRVPRNPRDLDGQGGHVGAPASCLLVFQACRQTCLDKSPSGRSGNALGGCMQECQAARKECVGKFAEGPKRDR